MAKASPNRRAPRADTHRSPTFDYALDFRTVNFRDHPELYKVGRGEEGVLLVEPYKGEILPHWRFATPDVAQESSRAIYALFLGYKDRGDFVGMDMARKFLQMGYTRARRYANHKGGRKYGADGSVLPYKNDPVKAEAAAVFYTVWKQAEADPEYVRLKAEHKQKYG
ncbi:DUF4385 domain-containing protein [Gemmata sp. JC717]|uniref:DUF4385 domain-containing protein n=1 Tax=Gemmata algarum TaxID=2975278 RepID=UPI0021BA6FD0|nr:DUF4385 domain-containing protein [Gemmata algarum]MDY3556509.1 DUF4385 domain-containing protein [Gemmata algarum]